MSKIILYGDQARQKLKAGVDKLANPVGVTLGPKGQNVIYSRPYGGPASTKDGYSVSREVLLDDPTEQLGADTIRYAAAKTVSQAGDGTTSATVLSQKMFAEGLRNISSGAMAPDLKRGMDLAVEETLVNLKALATPLKTKDAEGKTVIDWDKLTEIGSISANNDRQIGELISKVMQEIGAEGAITLEEGRTAETTYEVIAGMQYNKGLESPAFFTDMSKGICEFVNPLILLCADKINSFDELEPLFNKIYNTAMSPVDSPYKNRPLFIICDGISNTGRGSALELVVVNLKAVRCAIVKTPGFGDTILNYLKDLSAATGARVISAQHGNKLESVELEDLGSAERVIATARDTTIIKGAGSEKAIRERAAEIEHEIANAKDDYECDRAAERLAKLSGGVATIKAGGQTEIEMRAKKALIEDALRATRAAVEEGIVPGGGVAYLRLADMLGNIENYADVVTGYNIIKKALEYPCWLIAQNASHPNCSGDVVVSEVRKSSPITMGFNAQTGVYEDLVASGVIDPVKVVRCAIANAASAASILLTTGATIGESYDVQKQPLRP